MSSRFAGTGVALVSPMNEDSSIDYTGLKNLLSHIKNHADYLVVHGTTGETATTTQKEKEAILEIVKKENNKKLPIVCGIGGNNTAEVIERIKSCPLEGVDAILSVSPYYNKPSQEGIFQHYKAIAEASHLPIILYNVPGRTGSNIAAKTTARLSEIKNIIGIKEASGDFLQALDVVKYARKDFMLISGDDLMTVPLCTIGGIGAISVVANAFPKKFSEMIKFALKGNYQEATEPLKLFSDINPYLYEEGNPVGIKQALDLLGVCKSEVRLPLTRASSGLKSKIAATLAPLQ
jgi:4-hydroxy-tetrahydrodipicolinate synthase